MPESSQRVVSPHDLWLFPELHLAAARGDHETLRRRISRGDDLEATFLLGHSPDGEGTVTVTPLYIAAGSRFGATVETVRILLEAGANPRHETGRAAADRFCFPP